MPRPTKVTKQSQVKAAKTYASVERKIANLFKQKAEVEQKLQEVKAARNLLRQTSLAKKQKLKEAVKQGTRSKKELTQLREACFRAQSLFHAKNADAKEYVKELKELNAQTSALISASSWHATKFS